MNEKNKKAFFSSSYFMNNKKAVSLSILLNAVSACAPCDYGRLSKLPLDSSVPVEHREEVTFIREVRQFGIEQLGLNHCTQHYTTYSKTDEEAKLFYRLFVTKPTVLPNAWDEASIYFENQTNFREEVQAEYFISFVDTLEDELEYYKQEGYDVYTRNTTNYNPAGSKTGSSITPSFLNYAPEWQAHVVLHEICHDSLEEWIGAGFPSEMDESFCVLVGHAGADEYFKARKGIFSQEYKTAFESFTNYEKHSSKVIQTYGELQKLYQSTKPLSQKKEERKNIFAEINNLFSEEVNNALLWDRYPYVKYYPLMLQLYKSQNNSLRQTLEIMKDCPEKEEDALKYIQKKVKNK